MTDREILRELAKRYVDIATPERFEKTSALHRAVNDLKMIRPVVLMDELPWHEMDADGSLVLYCEDPNARRTETYFRRMLYMDRYLPVDTLFPPYLAVGPTFKNSGDGVAVEEKIIRQEDGNHIVAHEYRDQFDTDGCIEKITTPAIEAFPERTRLEYELISEIFYGILPVKKSGATLGWSPWDVISTWRGVTPLLIDLHERPEFCHMMMEKLLDNANKTLDAYEKLGLMESEIPQTSVHCTPALASGLAPSGEGTAKSYWGRGMAQIFAEVSPEMHDEFEMRYAVQFLSRFGLSYYGCCEPLHNKIHIVEKIPNLRKVGITPWADADAAAEAIDGRFVMSCKPNPAFVAVDVFDAGTVRDELNVMLGACVRTGASCDFVLKDISSCNKRPDNLYKWAETAMDFVKNY